MNAPNRAGKAWVHQQLCRGAWFAGLPAALQNALMDHASSRSFVAGEHIVEQGRQPEGLYVVLQGQIAFLRQLPGDREFLLTLAGPGYWFADPSVLLGEPMPHTVVARRDVRALVVPSPVVNRLREESATWAIDLARLHAERFIFAINGVADAAVLPREDFLRRRLLELARHLTAVDDQDGDIELAVSQSELALMIGVSRQTLNGYLSDLESQGLLEVGFRSIRLRRDQLTRLELTG